MASEYVQMEENRGEWRRLVSPDSRFSHFPRKNTAYHFLPLFATL